MRNNIFYKKLKNKLQNTVRYYFVFLFFSCKFFFSGDKEKNSSKNKGG